jgi:two-component system, LytTR family, sensor kinase
VKAINNNGKESTIIAAFPFSIAFAFWQTMWFKLLVAGMALIILFILYRLRINQITKRQEEKNRLQQIELEQYRQQLESEQITSFFSRSLVGKESLSGVLQDVAKNLIGKMGFEDCMIYLWNEDRTKLIQHAGHGVKGAIENTSDKEKYHIPAGKGIVGSAVQSKHPLLINDTSKDPRYISADNIIRYSELCVPVMLDDEVIGAINIEHSTRNYFNKHHIQTVSTIAALMANKIKAIESTAALHQKQLELAVTSRQLAEREIAMLRSQMNPHFIFNSLNSVQKFIWENKEEDAAEYLASFAKLMRSILENSRHEYISLQQEIDFLKLYVDLENRRSNNSFNYTIKTDETLNQDETLIPPMLLQPFIENAIWHGLNKKQSKGNLLVHFYKNHDQLICVVSDDGVGRQQNEKKNPEKKSLGISITQQRINRLMENTSRSASVTITDKVVHGMPAGTEVTVILPIQTNTGHA